MLKEIKNYDMTYCDGKNCDFRKLCKRWIKLYNVTHDRPIWMMSGSDKCTEFLEDKK